MFSAGKMLSTCKKFGLAARRRKFASLFLTLLLGGFAASSPPAFALFYGFNQQAQSYQHEGESLVQSGNYEQAVSAYTQAINLLPYDAVQGRADAYFGRAIANDVAGHFDQATQDYGWSRDYYLKAAQYASYGGNSADSGLNGGYDSQIGQELVNLVRWRATVNPRSSDYMEDAGPMKLWDLRKMPLKVFIDDSQESGWSSDLRDLIWRAINCWTNVSGSPVRFTTWNSASGADYIVTRPTAGGQIAVGSGGYTSGVDEPSEPNMLKQSKSLLSCRGYDGNYYSQEDKNLLYNLALHECGHALGMGGHSPSGQDIMYWKAPIFKLSDRDGNTIRRMYQGR
ncbi:MAG: matrixin family metalloprotease [Candidatus Obscuribacter sp.]|nr:matrixin family metalloprotease [Candidatus Obscuribacter sp.]